MDVSDILASQAAKQYATSFLPGSRRTLISQFAANRTFCATKSTNQAICSKRRADRSANGAIAVDNVVEVTGKSLRRGTVTIGDNVDEVLGLGRHADSFLEIKTVAKCDKERDRQSLETHGFFFKEYHKKRTNGSSYTKREESWMWLEINTFTLFDARTCEVHPLYL